jgi:hypothetical protein
MLAQQLKIGSSSGPAASWIGGRRAVFHLKSAVE